MISVAERSLGEGMSTSKSSSSQIAVSVRQYINELENPSFNYVPLFGQETALQIRVILASTERAKSCLRKLTLPVTGGRQQNFFTRITDWLMISGPVSADENGEEIKKTLSQLEQSSFQLSALFDVSLLQFL